MQRVEAAGDFDLAEGEPGGVDQADVNEAVAAAAVGRRGGESEVRVLESGAVVREVERHLPIGEMKILRHEATLARRDGDHVAIGVGELRYLALGLDINPWIETKDHVGRSAR